MRNLTLVIFTALCFAVAGFAAGLDGAWDVTYVIPDDTLETSITYKTKGSSLFVVTDDGEAEVGTFKDGAFSYTIPKYYSDQAGYSADLIIKGKLEGDKISGTWQWDAYDGTFTGKRAQ